MAKVEKQNALEYWDTINKAYRLYIVWTQQTHNVIVIYLDMENAIVRIEQSYIQVSIYSPSILTIDVQHDA